MPTKAHTDTAAGSATPDKHADGSGEAFTPGPWVASVNLSGNPLIRQKANRLVVAVVDIGGIGREHLPKSEGIANARLIAAAPDLYEALKLIARRADAVQEISGGTVQHSDLFVATIAARTALAKVTAA